MGVIDSEELFNSEIENYSARIRDALSKIEEKLCDLYINSCPDARKCPKAGCRGAGFVNKGSCKDMVECNICGTEWKDIFHMSLFEKVGDFFKKSFSFKGDTMTNLVKIWKGEPCPSCGIIIDKNGGCSHMQC